MGDDIRWKREAAYDPTSIDEVTLLAMRRTGFRDACPKCGGPEPIDDEPLHECRKNPPGPLCPACDAEMVLDHAGHYYCKEEES